MQSKSINSAQGEILFHLGNPDSPAQRRRHGPVPDEDDPDQKFMTIHEEDPDEEEERERRRKAERSHSDEIDEQR